MARKTKMNKITSAEKTALINKGNLQLKDEFLTYLRSVGRSEGTINGYDNDLLIVFTYVMEHLNNKDFARIYQDIAGDKVHARLCANAALADMEKDASKFPRPFGWKFGKGFFERKAEG